LDLIGDMETDEKGVIFSEWTSFLALIGKELKAEGYTFTRLDGSMNPVERQEAMHQFENGAPRFMLCSLKAAGVGITLTRANVVFLMSPWWNSAVENQAADRVYRIGQKRDVRIYRLVMAGSVEERMVEYQDAKAALGKGSMEKIKKKDLAAAKIAALCDLFGLHEENNTKWDCMDDFIVDDDEDEEYI
jgi:SWI/SNF-related matrix-associated actin-dependent regulator of chromatin subfamily A3